MANRKRLRKINKAELEMMASFVITVLLSNLDFNVAISKEEMIPPYIRALFKDKSSLLKIDDSYETYLRDFIASRNSQKKEDIVEFIATFLGNKAIFEAFCITYPGDRESLMEFASMVGAEEFYNILHSDKVYLKRREYVRNFIAYGKAAVNLYGVISVEEVYDLLCFYEEGNIDMNYEHYKRDSGDYQNTIIANPTFFDSMMIYLYFKAASTDLLTTEDGLLLANCFIDEFAKEYETVNELLDEDPSLNVIDYIDKNLSKTTYRDFYNRNMDKDLYIPTKEEFLSNEGYDEDDEYEKLGEELYNYLYDTYYKRIKTPKIFGELLSFVPKDVYIKVVTRLMLDFLSDHNPSISTDLDRALELSYDLLRDYGIRVKKDEKIALALILSKISSKIRKWSNRGFSDEELRLKERANPRIRLSNLAGFDSSSLKIRPSANEITEEIDPKTGTKINKVKRVISDSDDKGEGSF